MIPDMVMPDMSCGDIYDRMKDINPKVKVLLLSGYSINGQSTEIFDRGCNGFIQKPFKMKELSQKLRMPSPYSFKSGITTGTIRSQY